MKCPQYVEIEGKKYKINTSFKVALKCDEVYSREDISAYEKLLAIIYLLFGDEGLKDKENYDKLIDLAIKYLLCGEEPDNSNEKPDMDFKEDYRLIKASFRTDYGIDIDKENLHWWDFYTYLNGLKEDSILNRIRGVRTYDASKISDRKEKQEFIKLQHKVALKKDAIVLTKEQEKSMEELNKILGL